MKPETSSLLVQLATLLSVILGLGLVVWELQQARQLVQVQVTQDGLASLGSDLSAYYGEHAPHALARACFSPDELTRQDMLVLHYLWHNRLLQPFRRMIHTRIGEFEIDWQNGVRTAVADIAMFPAGQAWLLQYESADKHYQETVRRFAAEVRTQSCKNRMQVFAPSTGA